jgi:hypothetical protein
MPPKKSFSVNGTIYDIPTDKVAGFLQKFPHASEVQSFINGKDTFDIPVQKVSGFLQKFPAAKPLNAAAPPAPQPNTPHDQTQSYPDARWNQPPAPQPPMGKVTTDDKALAAMFPTKQQAVSDNAHVAQPAAAQFAQPKYDKAEDSPYVKQAIDNAVLQKNKQKGIAAGKADMNLGRQEIIDAYNRKDIDAVRNPATGKVEMKPTGNFWQVFKDKYNETFFNGVVDDYLSKAPKEEAIQFLNNIGKTNPLYESKYAPKSLLGEGAGWVGGQADYLINTTAGGAAGALLAPTTGGASIAGAIAMTTPQVAKSAFSQSLQHNYAELKKQNPAMSDGEAYDKAQNAAYAGAAIGVATNAVLSGSIFGKSEVAQSAAKGFMSALGKSLGHTISTAPKSILTGAVAPVLNDAASAANGVKVDWNESLKKGAQAAEEWAILHAAMGVVTAPQSARSYLRPQAENVLASAPREQVKEMMQQQEADGKVPAGTTETVMTKLQEFDQAKQSIPAHVELSEETRAAITGKMLQRNQVNKQIEELHKYGSAFNSKIEDLEKQKLSIETDIDNMSRSNNPFSHEVDNLTGERLHPVKVFEDLSGKEKGASSFLKNTAKRP